MAGLNDLLSYIQSRVDNVSIEQHYSSIEGGSTTLVSEGLTYVFEDAVQQALREIKLGVPSTEFADLVVINFIISASQSGYPNSEIRSFVEELITKSEDGGTFEVAGVPVVEQRVYLEEEDTPEDDFLAALIAEQSGRVTER